jgi:hypothetical protein
MEQPFYMTLQTAAAAVARYRSLLVQTLQEPSIGLNSAAFEHNGDNSMSERLENGTVNNVKPTITRIRKIFYS